MKTRASNKLWMALYVTSGQWPEIPYCWRYAFGFLELGKRRFGQTAEYGRLMSNGTWAG